MKGFIGDIDWVNAESMKYWSIPASYSEEKRKSEVINAIYSGDYYGALKVDGYYQRLIKDEDGNCFMVARNKNVKGEAVNKIEWVPQLQDFMAQLPNGTVLLSECYLPGHEGSKNITSLLGCLKDKCIARQESGQKLHFYIFDICAYDGVNLVDTKAIERFQLLEKISTQLTSSYVEWAKYYNGKELWNHLQDYLASGREGIVITRKDCPIYFKRTPAHMTIKVKKELQETLDVVIMGANAPTRLYNGKELMSWKYWENLSTGEKVEGALYKNYSDGDPIEPITKMYFLGGAGSLKIGAYKDGKLVQVGNLSGLEEEILLNWKSYLGKVIEITAMEVMADSYGLRHPRPVRLRSDKMASECDWYRIFENV